MTTGRSLLIATLWSLTAFIVQAVYCSLIFSKYWADELSRGYSVSVFIEAILLNLSSNVWIMMPVVILIFAVMLYRNKPTVGNLNLWWIIPLLLIVGVWIGGFQYPKENLKLTTYLYHVRQGDSEDVLIQPVPYLQGFQFMTLDELYADQNSRADVLAQESLRREMRILSVWSTALSVVFLFLGGRMFGLVSRRIHLAIILPAVFIFGWLFVNVVSLIIYKLVYAEVVPPLLGASIFPAGLGMALIVLQIIYRRMTR